MFVFVFYLKFKLLVNRCKSKFVCTLGPASRDPSVLKELILNGMSVARLNFSHCTHEVLIEI